MKRLLGLLGTASILAAGAVPAVAHDGHVHRKTVEGKYRQVFIPCKGKDSKGAFKGKKTRKGKPCVRTYKGTFRVKNGALVVTRADGAKRTIRFKPITRAGIDGDFLSENPAHFGAHANHDWWMTAWTGGVGGNWYTVIGTERGDYGDVEVYVSQARTNFMTCEFETQVVGVGNPDGSNYSANLVTEYECDNIPGFWNQIGRATHGFGSPNQYKWLLNDNGEAD